MTKHSSEVRRWQPELHARHCGILSGSYPFLQTFSSHPMLANSQLGNFPPTNVNGTKCINSILKENSPEVVLLEYIFKKQRVKFRTRKRTGKWKALTVVRTYHLGILRKLLQDSTHTFSTRTSWGPLHFIPVGFHFPVFSAILVHSLRRQASQPGRYNFCEMLIFGSNKGVGSLPTDLG